MSTLIATRMRRLGWGMFVFLLCAASGFWFTFLKSPFPDALLTNGEIMGRLFVFPTVAAVLSVILLSSCALPIAQQQQAAPSTPASETPQKPFMAQVVGLQWLNPLQRRDYPTEWQLLWTLGLAKPNKNDDMVRTEPQFFSSLQFVAGLANGWKGTRSFKEYYSQYPEKVIHRMWSNYFSDPDYFYNVHGRDSKKTWRELAGIHVEYAIPQDSLDAADAGISLQDTLIKYFRIGIASSPTLWTRNTPPDVHVTPGGPNAGFTSLSAALDYLQAHPQESVWVMGGDTPSYPPKEDQLNENMVLLVLTGPDFKTERNALAWIGYPATRAAIEFEAIKDLPSRTVQAWQATIQDAASNAGKRDSDIGYVIHDAHNTHPDSSDRIACLAQALTTEIPEFEFNKQTFNTSALLGDMGAGSAFTNMALGIAYANHLGKHVLVAGVTDAGHPGAVLISPPAKVRPIDHEADWFRARGEGNAYMMWWGWRYDMPPHSQGYSY